MTPVEALEAALDRASVMRRGDHLFCGRIVRFLRQAGYEIAPRPKHTARRFPRNTCGASRHVEMVADDLRRHGRLGNGVDPRHLAASMTDVVESLWRARDRIAELERDRDD